MKGPPFSGCSLAPTKSPDCLFPCSVSSVAFCSNEWFRRRRVPRLRATFRCATLRRVSDVTRILERVEQGDPKAADELLPLVYEELRKLAVHNMAHEAAGHTLQPTALVHEAWLRLFQSCSGAPTAATISSWRRRGPCGALERLSAADAIKAKLVELRFFTGLSLEEAAQVLGVSAPTAKRYWAYARAWLFQEIERLR